MELLIVVDMQNDFITGSLGSKAAQAILPAVVAKLKAWQGRVLFTLDTHYENYLQTQEGRRLPVVHCRKDTWGWQLADEVKAAYGREIPREDLFLKETFGSLALWNYAAELNAREPIREIQVIGLVTDICVAANAVGLKAAVPEAEITVDAACSAGGSPQAFATALDALAGLQINVIHRNGKGE